MGILNPDEMFNLRSWVLEDKAKKSRVQPLVKALGLTVGLGVVSRGETDSAQEGAEGLSKLGSQMRPPIRYHMLRLTMSEGKLQRGTKRTI